MADEQRRRNLTLTKYPDLMKRRKQLKKEAAEREKQALIAAGNYTPPPKLTGKEG